MRRSFYIDKVSLGTSNNRIILYLPVVQEIQNLSLFELGDYEKSSRDDIQREMIAKKAKHSTLPNPPRGAVAGFGGSGVQRHLKGGAGHICSGQGSTASEL
jgi:hypothetical protein